MHSALADKLLNLINLARAFRFGVVGVIAAGVYLAVFNLVAAPIGPLPGFAANLAALSVSILVSYFGHHAYTFRLAGEHVFHFTKFAIVTAILIVLSTVVAYLCDRYGHYPPYVTSLVIVVLYPCLSYVTHCLWTFGAARKEHNAAGT